MKITIESTDRIVELVVGAGVVPARIWQGRTESGMEVHCFVTRVAIAKDADSTEFERELGAEHAPPRRDIASSYPINARLVL